jgi:hypothetical protein
MSAVLPAASIVTTAGLLFPVVMALNHEPRLANLYSGTPEQTASPYGDVAASWSKALGRPVLGPSGWNDPVNQSSRQQTVRLNSPNAPHRHSFNLTPDEAGPVHFARCTVRIVPVANVNNEMGSRASLRNGDVSRSIACPKKNHEAHRPYIGCLHGTDIVKERGLARPDARAAEFSVDLACRPHDRIGGEACCNKRPLWPSAPSCSGRSEALP